MMSFRTLQQNSFLRYLIGFLAGATTSSASTALTFLAFVPIPPESSPSRHDVSGALALMVVVMVFAGGFIGGRGFNADFLSDLLRPIFGSYAVIGFLSLLAFWGHWGGIAAMIGFSSVGIVASAGCSLLLLRYFPPKEAGSED
jgi:hypothetical protein